MKKIVLLCAAGMSTSLLVTKMQAAADKSGFACEIRAYGVAQAPTVIPEADVVLLGPQVKYTLAKFQKEYADEKIAAIDMSRTTPFLIALLRKMPSSTKPA